MARYPDSFMAQVRDKTDLVDLVSTYVHVERKGRDYWACCPFHNEKTPSFQIKADQQYYICYGCGKKGDIFRFLMDHDQMTFTEAVEYLAKRAGLPIPELIEDPEALARKALRDKVYEINRLTARFYYENLSKPEGIPALKYFEKRGFDAKTINKFGLGYSTDFTSLPKFLLSKGYDYDSMIQAGVASKTERGDVIDFFGKRIIIPIINGNGKIIGFSARVLVPKPEFAKYKNTSNTPVFFKGKNLFGINLYKKFHQGDVRAMILVEGHLDVVSLHQAGIGNAVASMGTALTIEQCREIKRYADVVYVSFDGDSAGQHATLRGLDMLKNEGLEVKVVQLRDGLDPDDYVKKYGKDGYLKLLDQALPLIDYKLLNAEEGYDLNNKDDRIKYAKSAVSILQSLTAFEREIYVKTIEEKSGIKAEVLLKQSFDDDVKKELEAAKDKKPADASSLLAERYVLSSIIHSKGYVSISELSDIKECIFDPRYAAVLEYFLMKLSKEGKITASDIFDATEDEVVRDDLLCAVDTIPATEQAEYYLSCVQKLKKEKKDKELSRLVTELKEEKDTQRKEEMKIKIKELMNTKPND
ncbi:MAG: DNA primase [Clostridia bacterium]|nr:DNA primase [Clostridia bacterium]